MLSVLSSVSSFENPAFDMSTLFVLFLLNLASKLLSVNRNVLDRFLPIRFPLNFETSCTVNVTVRTDVCAV